MRHTLLAPMILALAGVMACAEDTCPSGVELGGQCQGRSAGRVVDLTVTQPLELAARINWPADGIYDATQSVLLLGAYVDASGVLRIFGGPGQNEDGKSALLYEDTRFDIPTVVSDLGIYTEPFRLKLPTETGLLVVEQAVIHTMTVITADGREIPSRGRVLGVVTESIPGASPDADFDGDGTDDSWMIAFDFATELTWMR